MTKGKNLAEIADRHQQFMALAFFLLSLKYLVSAANKVFSINCSLYLNLAETISFLAALGIIIWIGIWKFRNLSRDQRRTYFAPDGYLFSIGKKAMSKSWVLTFCWLAILAPFSRKLFPHLTTHFYIELTLAFMLGSFSIVFFILDRRDDVDDS